MPEHGELSQSDKPKSVAGHEPSKFQPDPGPERASPDNSPAIRPPAAADPRPNLTRLDPTARANALLQMQRTQGNSYVGRMRALRTQRLPRATSDESPVALSGPTLLVDDSASQAGPDQMHKSKFISQLRAAVCLTTDEALQGTVWSSAGCPYIEQWLAYYGSQDAQHIERAIRKYAPETAAAAAAADDLPVICERVRRSVGVWVKSGQLTGIPSDIPTGAPIAPPATPNQAAQGGPIQRKATDGAARASDEPEAVRAGLGAGQSLDGDVRSRMEPAFGQDFSHVQLHTDAPGAELAASLNARAFTVGEHVAFGAGEYRPGTPIGDALIAHELAHVSQQAGGSHAAGGMLQKGAIENAALEEDADDSAVRTVVGLWSGLKGGVSHIAQNAIPHLKSGLQLQRCKNEKKELEGLEADNVYGLAITTNPPAEPGLVGSTVQFGLRWDENEGYSFGVSKWMVTAPGGDQHFSGVHNAKTWEVKLDKPGKWSVAVSLYGLGKTEKALWREFEVVEPNALAEEKLKQLTGMDYTKFRAGLALRHYTMAQGGVPDQRSGTSWITSSGQNPGYRPQEFPYKRELTFTIHPSPNAKQFTWRGGGAVATNWPDKTTETSQHVIFDKDGVFDITCEEFDEKGQPLGTKATYVQAIQPQEKAERVEQWQNYMGTVQKEMEELEEGKEVPVRGVFVSKQTGDILPLSLFLGPHKTKNQWRLLDLTAGVDKRVYTGQNAREALEDYKDKGKKKYPLGLIRLDIPPLAQQKGAADNSMSFETEIPESWSHWIARKTGLLSLGLTVLGVAALFVPGGQVVAPYLFAAGAAAGAASSGASLVDRLQQDEVSGVGVAIDVLGIVSSIVGGAGGWKSLRAIQRGAGLTYAGKYLLWTGFTANAVDGVLVGVEAWREIDRIHEARARGEITRSQETDAIARVVAGIAQTGALLAYGSMDVLGQAKSRVGGLLGDPDIAGAGRLTAREIGSLSMLDDLPLQNLKGATDTELRAVAQLAGSDPKRFSLLAQEFGDDALLQARANGAKTLDELETLLLQKRQAAQGGSGTDPGAPGAGTGTTTPDVAPGTTTGGGTTGTGGAAPADPDGAKAVAALQSLEPQAGTRKQQVLVIGAERQKEFEHAQQWAKQGHEVEVINPSRTEEANKFEAAGGKFHEQKIQQLPAGEKYDLITEQFPQPLGPTKQTMDHAEAIVTRLKPGGRWSFVTEASAMQESAETMAEVARHSGCTVERHELSPDSPYAKSWPERPGYIKAKEKLYLYIIQKPEVVPPAPVVPTPATGGGPGGSAAARPTPTSGKLTSEQHLKYKDKTVYEVKQASAHPDDQAEVRMAEFFAAQGQDVHFSAGGHGEADLTIGGIATDVKNLHEAHPNNIVSAVQRGAKQGPQVVIDATTVGLTREQAQEGIAKLEEIAKKHPGKLRDLKTVIIVFTDGSTLVHQR